MEIEEAPGPYREGAAPGRGRVLRRRSPSRGPCPPHGVHRPPRCLASEGQCCPSLGPSKDSQTPCVLRELWGENELLHLGS